MVTSSPCGAIPPTVAAIAGRNVTLDCVAMAGETVVARMEARVIAPKRPKAPG